MSATQVSAFVSTETKLRMDRYVKASGVTRAHVIEQALLHHLRALEELPPDLVIPARVVLSRKSAAVVRDLTSHPPRPTAAMRKLFGDR